MGTVLLFPGRTEYIEKYGITAADLAAAGYATLSIDWRGQGLADRLIADPLLGHVRHFSDYQLDVQAMLEAARVLALPQPWHLLAHSMGGCIGLRALIEGLPVKSAVFTGPMWGIRFAPLLRPVAWVLSGLGTKLGFGNCISPGTSRMGYVLQEPFENNALTGDRVLYNRLIRHLKAEPRLELGGPSLRWLNGALRECRALARLPAPGIPCLTWQGTDEQIVSPAAIERRMADWPQGRLEILQNGRHEVLMGSAHLRAQVIGESVAFFGRASG